jgi:hypothetical protein
MLLPQRFIKPATGIALVGRLLTSHVRRDDVPAWKFPPTLSSLLDRSK